MGETTAIETPRPHADGGQLALSIEQPARARDRAQQNRVSGPTGTLRIAGT
jgi:hypothetical protein